MKNLINIQKINEIIPHRDRHLLNYITKYPKRFLRMEEILKDGVLSQSQSCRLSKFPSTSYFLILKYGEKLMNYFEEIDVNYENTEYFNIINSFVILEKAYIEGQMKGMKEIADAAVDKIQTDAEGKEYLVKKGDWKARAFLLKYSRAKEFSDVSSDDSTSSSGVNITIGLPTGMTLDQVSLMSQENIMNNKK